MILTIFSAQALEIPNALESWESWVLYGKEEQACPTDRQGRNRCSYPSRIVLDVSENGADFTLHITRRAPGWSILPGDAGENHWPEKVAVNGVHVPVTEKHTDPRVWLEAGTHSITGRIGWKEFPQSLRLPESIALTELKVNGKAVAHPDRREKHRLWLKSQTHLQAVKTQAATPDDSLQVTVFRLITDGIPARVETRLKLVIAGKEREEILPNPLLEGSTITDIRGQLPARLGTDDKLRIQTKPGTWWLTLVSRREAPLPALELPSQTPHAAQAAKTTQTPQTTQKSFPWEDEIWAFQPNRQYRTVDITPSQGARNIDPTHTELPAEWHQFSAYRLKLGASLAFKTRRSGEDQKRKNQIMLNRMAWLGMGGEGITVQDTLSGTLNEHWRLGEDGSQKAPDIQRAEVNGTLQPITLDDKKRKGLELRSAHLNLVTTGSLSGAHPVTSALTLPANGWNTEMETVSTVFNIAPGWTVLAATGVDKSIGTWIDKWDLWDVFILLLVSLAVGRFWSVRWGIFTLVALGILFHESTGLKSTILTIIFCGALLKNLPKGKLYGLVNTVRLFAFFAFVAFAIPYVIEHVRYFMYPHLQTAHSSYAFERGVGVSGQQMAYDEFTAPRRNGRLQKKEMNRMEEKRLRAMQEAPASAPAYEMEAYMDSDEGAGTAGMDKKSWNAAKVANAMSSYGSLAQNKLGLYGETREDMADLNLTLATGPGLPEWSWRQVRLNWNYPVAVGETYTLWLLSPLFTRLLELLKVALLLILGARLMLTRLPDISTLMRCDWKKIKQLTGAFLLAIALMGHAFPVAASQKADVRTSPDIAVIPPQYMLDELANRLLEKPKCLPHCAALNHMNLEVQGKKTTLTLHYHTLAEIAVPLPQFGRPWQPATVTIEGTQTPPTLLRKQNELLMLLPKGVHTVTMHATMPEQLEAYLSLPLPPQKFTNTIKGIWKIEGLGRNGLPGQGLRLVQNATIQPTLEGKDKPKGYQPTVIPPYALVKRSFQFGKTLQVITHVYLQHGTGLTFDYPLLEGERVLTRNQNVDVKNGVATLTVSANQPLSFQSVLKDDTRLITLKTPQKEGTEKAASFREMWDVYPSILWQLEHKGLTPVFTQQSGRWHPVWEPVGGEELELKLHQPTSAGGEYLTIRNARLTSQPGQRILKQLLNITFETSRPVNHSITLPPEVDVTQARLNGRQLPLEHTGRTFIIPLGVGQQTFSMEWKRPQERHLKNITPDVDLGAPATNLRVVLDVPHNRWILFAAGPWGPAVLLWSILGAYILLSFVLGRTKLVPLKTWQWFLLMFGFSQVEPLAMLVPLGWLLGLGVREKWKDDLSKTWWKFNLVQIVLAFMAFGAIAGMLTAVQRGLLGGARTYITGGNSNGRHLEWYIDATSGAFPDVMAITPHIWVYKALMMLWSFWLAWLFVGRLLKWAWQAYSAGGLWQSIPKPKMPQVPSKKEPQTDKHPEQTTGQKTPTGEPLKPLNKDTE